MHDNTYHTYMILHVTSMVRHYDMPGICSIYTFFEKLNVIFEEVESGIY